MREFAEYTEEELLYYMGEAYAEAEKAYEKNEIPVGCVIVWDKQIVSRAHNTRETDKNALCHAELSAVNSACEKLGGWRLHKADLFVTLEPCVMCAGACINARINRVYFGAKDERYGAFGGFIDLQTEKFNHMPVVIGGVMENECARLLQRFFKSLRARKY